MYLFDHDTVASEEGSGGEVIIIIIMYAGLLFCIYHCKLPGSRMVSAPVYCITTDKESGISKMIINSFFDILNV